ncbi:MAG: hypothetical protein ACK50J_12195 [Planctomyces sp.]
MSITRDAVRTPGKSIMPEWTFGEAEPALWSFLSFRVNGFIRSSDADCCDPRRSGRGAA